MKKSKLLMPLVGVAALGATVAPIVTLTSCGEKPDKNINKIVASTKKANTYVGITLQKADIEVRSYNKDGTSTVVTGWTCDQIGAKGYHFSKAETKNFTIKYRGHTTTLKVTAELAGAMAFDEVLPANLVVGTGYATETTVHVYAVNVEQQDPHEVDIEYLDIKSNKTDIVEYNATNHALVAKKAGTATITATIKDMTEAAYTATMSVTVSDKTDQITKIESDGEDGAKVTIAAGNEDGICNVPEFAKIDNKDLPVTQIVAGATVKNIETLALPATISEIDGKFAGDGATDNHIYTIMYDGTARQWSRITCDAGWAGYGVTGAWCYGDGTSTYVNFTATHDAEYVKGEESKPNYFEASMGSIIAKNAHSVGFDIAQAYEETEAEINKYQIIDIKNTGLAVGYLTVDALYVNGEKWTEGTGAKTYAVSGGRHDTKVTLDASTKLTLNDRVVITFSSPLVTASVVTVTLEKA